MATVVSTLCVQIKAKLRDRLSTFVFIKNKYKSKGHKKHTLRGIIEEALIRYLTEEELILRRETKYIDAPIWDIDKEKDKILEKEIPQE